MCVCVCVVFARQFQITEPKVGHYGLSCPAPLGLCFRLLMTAFNLCRGPVSASRSVCAFLSVSLQPSPAPETQRASASFSHGCLCVTSPLNPAGQSFYTAALSTLHFPTQHASEPPAPVHSTKLPIASPHMCTHTQNI